MQQLTIVGTEDDLLVLATESGQRFTLEVEAARTAVRRAGRERQPATHGPLPSPRDIQTRIRSGMSAEDVAELLGADLEDVRRFAGPVYAEREHVVDQALAVPVLMGVELDPNDQPTFGVAIRGKLAEIEASGERWTSWKEQAGWVVKLEFTANEVDHDARWSFDPKRSALSPQNADATQLSRQGPMPEGLIPRLRAVEVQKDSGRFDSDAFGPRHVAAEPEAERAEAPAVREAATKRAPNPGPQNRDTADLLDALRRRRGQRETAPAEPEHEPEGDREPRQQAEPAERAQPVALFDTLEPGFAEDAVSGHDDATAAPAPVASGAEPTRRRGRAAMPSWDEIVFGARSDD